MKAPFIVILTVLGMTVPAAAVAAGGGPWADDGAVSSTTNTPANQGREQSRQRVDQAESAGRNQLDQAQQGAHDSLQRNLERQRQENSQEVDSLRQRANPSGFQPRP